METGLQQMMARLLAEIKAFQAEMEARAEARQEKMISEMEARAEARQEKADAKAEARLQRSLAFLRGLMSSEERTAICTVPPVDCPDNSKAGPEEKEANSGATKAAVEWPELREGDRRRKHRVIGGRIWRSTLGRATSPRGKEAVPRQCWVPAKVLCRPQASHTSRRPCRSKTKNS
jgi:hypothetical protein